MDSHMLNTLAKTNYVFQYECEHDFCSRDIASKTFLNPFFRE